MTIQVLRMYRGFFVYEDDGEAADAQRFRCHVNGERIEANTIEALKQHVDRTVLPATQGWPDALLEQLQRIIAGELNGAAAKAVLDKSRQVVTARHQSFLDALNVVLKAEDAMGRNNTNA